MLKLLNCKFGLKSIIGSTSFNYIKYLICRHMPIDVVDRDLAPICAGEMSLEPLVGKHRHLLDEVQLVVVR